MASMFGDDGLEDLLGEQNHNENELTGDDDENENPFGDNENGEENEEKDEQQAVKVEPKKRAVRNPRPRLTVETLSGQRGIQTIEEYFKDITFKGKGYEKQDLDEIIRRLQHWAHRMYPTYKFDDVLVNIERLGKKKPLHVHMSRYRLGLLEHLKQTIDGELRDDDEDAAIAEVADEPFDEFDALLGEQIAISRLAPNTPAAGRPLDTPGTRSTITTHSFARGNAAVSTPYIGNADKFNDSDLAQPLPPSQPATPVSEAKKLSTEQMALIAENRRKAQERLQLKRLKEQQ